MPSQFTWLTSRLNTLRYFTVFCCGSQVYGFDDNAEDMVFGNESPIT